MTDKTTAKNMNAPETRLKASGEAGELTPGDGKIALWLDDVRPMPEAFDVHVKTAEEAIALLRRGIVVKISFDHDLGP
jgi:hypothetical protein